MCHSFLQYKKGFTSTFFQSPRVTTTNNMPATLKPSTKVFTLNNGVEIPAVGLGTWRALDNDGYNAVLYALKHGYRHIDDAKLYENEEQVGKAINDSGIPRKELFVTSKLWNTDHKNVEAALDESLKKLGLEYVDLYLIHWPQNTDQEVDDPLKYEDYIDTWKELQRIYKEGKKVRAIGVANFTINKLEKLLNANGVDVVPAINQVETHPLLNHEKLIAYLKSKNIHLTAYSPFGSDKAPVLENKVVKEIAQKNGVDPGQLLVSWAVQRDTIVIPKSVTEKRILSNFETFTLSKEDFDALNELEGKEGTKRYNDTPFNNFDE